MATDDVKIAECCRGFGADVVMTSVECRNGRRGFFVHFQPWVLNLICEIDDL